MKHRESKAAYWMQCDCKLQSFSVVRTIPQITRYVESCTETETQVLFHQLEIQSAPITSREKEKAAGFNGLIRFPESLVSQQIEEPFGFLQALMTPVAMVTHIP